MRIEVVRAFWETLWRCVLDLKPDTDRLSKAIYLGILITCR